MGSKRVTSHYKPQLLQLETENQELKRQLAELMERCRLLPPPLPPRTANGPILCHFVNSGRAFRDRPLVGVLADCETVMAE